MDNYSESIVIARSAQDLYDMVSDVTRMGEWSPVCKACWWDEHNGPVVGAWFTGRNERPDRTWETRACVEVADRGREFAFLVDDALVRWGYSFATVEDGCEVTESWKLLPPVIALLEQRFGSDELQAQISVRYETAREGIGTTLAAIKTIAEQR